MTSTGNQQQPWFISFRRILLGVPREIGARLQPDAGSRLAKNSSKGKRRPHPEKAPSFEKAMKILLLLLLTVLQQIAMPQNVAEPKPEDATRAIIRLFDQHDIVMFAEIHSGKQEYEWLCKLVKTPGFSDHVDDVAVEFGNALYQKDVDRYVAGDHVPFDQVQKAWRNMIVSTAPVSPVYGWFYQAVRDANLQSPGRHRIRLLMGSPPGDWDKIKTAQDLAPYEAQREQWYLHVVKDEVLARHHRALLIMGAMHFLRGSDQALQDEMLEQQHKPVPPVDRGRLAPGYIERELRAAGADSYLAAMGQM
jgi:hypothetical protein